MSDKNITDKDYLFLSSLLKARETNMITRDRLERMLGAGSASEAARQLAETGWPDMTGMNAQELDAALSAYREALFQEVGRYVPEKEVADFFRLRYDYHNAKALVKGEGAGVNVDGLLSQAGRVAPEKLREAFQENDFRFIPAVLGQAMDEAKGILARTGNPQLADFALDRAYFAEMAELAGKVQDPFLDEYRRILADCANLRICVRCLRMGKDGEFLRLALIPGGNVSGQALAQGAFSGEGLTGLFSGTPFQKAAELGMEAAKGGPLTEFERECDNAVARFLSSVRMSGFGSPLVVGYLAAEENNITAVRMVLTGLLAGIEPQRLQERLRETYA